MICREFFGMCILGLLLCFSSGWVPPSKNEGIMCYEVTCSSCGKKGWEGCGRHVPWVYKNIPEGHHCHCKTWPGVDPSAPPPQGCSIL